MPIYECPVCKRRVEKPEGTYFCAVCGPEARMIARGSPEVKWKKFVPKNAKVVEMSPIDFLSKVPSPCREGRTALEDLHFRDCWSQSSIDYIMKQVEKRMELDPPMLDYTRVFRGFPTHEGRHTAFVAYKLGVKKIPVIVFGEEAQYK